MKISVVMPAYNSEKTLRESINSVLAQNGTDIELIVINDGSSDKTAEILSEYGDMIISINILNNGVANARNIGISMATGDYIMFVDSDDLLEDGAISHISELISKTDADVIRFGYTVTFDGKEKHLPSDRFKKDELVTKEHFIYSIYPHFINGIRLNSMCVTCAKRFLYEGLSVSTSMKTAEDAYLMTDVYTRAQSVCITEKPLYIYKKHKDSLTGAGLSVISKYLCNIKLSIKILSLLPAWNMASPKWYFKTLIRPVRLTFDKLKRIKDGE